MESTTTHTHTHTHTLSLSLKNTHASPARETYSRVPGRRVKPCPDSSWRRPQTEMGRYVNLVEVATDMKPGVEVHAAEQGAGGDAEILYSRGSLNGYA
ncbi:hypothetical protein BC938DRAFT_475959 [Jimgerdemannia flammicorona]|uniref:Uncharacterized protein n=1 Tax=Jimgerdemannia flammicorona TaxID=994334 RepID=A0A433QR26_9FUNG|nr:hypothetical protein BC938DRAFT_475959 [Jimgerdemannia flammicorona]